MEHVTVQVNGIVQSVGFRPFVYRRAIAHGLNGTVRNLGDAGARIELEGAATDVEAFLTDLREESPPLARVETIDIDRERIVDPTFETFRIIKSAGSHGGGGTVPPDTATCEKCLADVRDSDSRYQGYWATSCVDCGPRFTVIKALPYDRPATSMAPFPLCDACREEYEDPTDRRYHAQAMACPACGPMLQYGTLSGTSSPSVTNPEQGRDPFPDAFEPTADGRDAIARAASTLDRGETVVLKGIGGAHLACDATDDKAVELLRERTGRPEKPFALMVPDIEQAAAIAAISDKDRSALRSPRRPIILVERDDIDTRLASGVSPDLHTLGVMLPYSSIHHLLFDEVDRPLVMTSANLPGKPMLTANSPLIDGLSNVADAFLLHDRRIVARCDDSVGRIVDGKRRLIRRSRGFVPVPVPSGIEESTMVLSTGPELDVTAGVLNDGNCYLTQHIGDVTDLDTLAYFEEAIAHLLDVTGLDHPPIVAHDAHPEFNTTDYAHRLVADGTAERAIAVQHHHAHAASVLAEHSCERAVALTLDGTGYGPDGTVWGGEVLETSLTGYKRAGGLASVPMPGGDQATRHPARLAAGLLHMADPASVVPTLDRHNVAFPDGVDERTIVRQQLETGVNTPRTSSAGRFLDAVSALLGACTERTYEGEPAMKLEALASGGSSLDIEIPSTIEEGRPVINTPHLFRQLVNLREAGQSQEDVAATAQDTLACGLANLAVEGAIERDWGTVVLSGGVAYNDHIARRIRERVTEAGLQFLSNERVPPGDGGIAYGQAAIAAVRERER